MIAPRNELAPSGLAGAELPTASSADAERRLAAARGVARGILQDSDSFPDEALKLLYGNPDVTAEQLIEEAKEIFPNAAA